MTQTPGGLLEAGREEPESISIFVGHFKSTKVMLYIPTTANGDSRQNISTASRNCDYYTLRLHVSIY